MSVVFAALDADYQGKKDLIDAAVARVLASGWFILGKEVAAFEAAFADFLGVAHVVACANGTEAIALALLAAGAEPGDEVLLPANACVPVIAAVRLAGAKPCLCDVDPGTLTLDPESAAREKTGAARFLLAVHFYGGVADVEALAALAEREGLTLIEDCAQSHGATFRGRSTGGFGRAASFSFYPTKNLGAYGDGGAVATNDAGVAQRLRQLRQYGWSRRDYAEQEGRNSRLDELQAAILAVKLPFLATENERRREIAARYDAAFAGLPLRLLSTREGAVSARHLYPVRTERRDALRAHLAACGVETAIHYPTPLHLHPAYAFLGRVRGDFPVSEAACDTVLSLPLHPALSDSHAETVIAAVRGFFS
ncbi:MAG TPA: DegT/DnrJ/EryC1/StrS family aminotransferase [Thermoanaerobaculia bacterium]|jgi:dTDP-4-amino-4,6-dideoxygalactose transaminase|nr:DegT/DnrJ/EryC1/StrS family aminotransferase [Thermoanaerobaculia bacterium]